MAIYSMHVGNVSRAAGSSAVASVSYITSRPMTDERTGERYYGFGRRERVSLVGVALPHGAPDKWANPAVLANAMEASDKRADARPAKKIMVALPRELSNGQQVQALESFVRECLTSQGYAAVWAIHTDKDGNNPHAHIIAANRRIDEHGKWLSKSSSTFALDEHGQRIPVIDPTTGEQKTRANGRLVWKRVTISNNLLNSEDYLKHMREQWARTCNQLLPDGVSIDHRSLKAQGIDRLPTVHEGYAAREIEKRGGISPLCEHNRQIRHTNGLLSRLRAELTGLRDRLTTLIRAITRIPAAPQAQPAARPATSQPGTRDRLRRELQDRASHQQAQARQPRATRSQTRPQQPRRLADPMAEARRQLEAERDRRIEEATSAYLRADERRANAAKRMENNLPDSLIQIGARTTTAITAYERAGESGLLRRHHMRRQAQQATAGQLDALRQYAPWLRLPDQPPQDVDQLRQLAADLHEQAIRHELRPYDDAIRTARERLDQARTQPITDTDVRTRAEQISHEHAKQQPATTAETRETKPRKPRPHRETTPTRTHATRQPEPAPDLPVEDAFPLDWGLDGGMSSPDRHHGMRL